MVYDGASDAVQVADLISNFGNQITLTDGTTVITAIVDERYDEIRKNVSARELERAIGRVALFYMTPTDFAKIPNGSLLPYDGEQFTLGTSRSSRFGNVTSMVSVIGASGGYQ